MRISDWSSDVCSSDLGASYLLVSETNEYRIWRYWLKGVRAGQQEIFADNLPGFPDNLSIDDGHVWQALYAPRNAALDAIADRPTLRKLAYRLPRSEEHTSELQSLMRLSYAVFCLKKHNTYP